MPNNYVAPYLLTPRTDPTPVEGQFTVPVCTTPERFDKIMNALFYYGQHSKKDFDFDHLIDWLAGVNNIVEGCVDFAPICRSIGLHDDRLTWFPENPFTPNDEVPSGYPFHPFTVVTSSIVDSVISVWGLGYKVGDVFVDLSKLPVFSSWFDIQENYANMPSLTISGLEGKGKVSVHFLNIIQGGRILIVLDGEIDILHLRTIEVGRDAISFPPETTVDFIVEVPIETLGSHTVQFVWYPTVDVSAIPVSFGGGVRDVILCGFGVSTMPEDPCCPETNDLLTTNNEWLQKIYTLMKNGIIADIQFKGGSLPPDEAAGDCAPDHFDHDGDDEEPDELLQRYKALCLTVNQYVKGILLKVLRDMQVQGYLVDFVSSKFPDVVVPDRFTNLTIVYPHTFAGINTFFDAATDNIDLQEVACALLDGLTGDTNNSSANFRDALLGYTTTALMQSFVDITHASNAVLGNYKAFNTQLNQAKESDLDAYECPCGTPPPSGDCGGFTPVDWTGSGTTFEYMGECVWKINSGSGSPYNSSIKDLFDRPFFITNPPPELAYPAPGCANSEQIGANGCPDQIGGCNFSTGLWDGCYSTIRWDSGTPNYYKFRLCTEVDECP